MKKYKVIGLMSGTSLDGLDIAYCEFVKNKKWRYKILFAETIVYSKKWKKNLSSVFRKSKKEILKLDIGFGKFSGEKINSFIRKHKINPDFISSHGHTVFHQPEKRITLQIGSGKIIASVCNIPAVCDFRSGDVALGGQGAPLVPIADHLLFSEYDFCLNLGGIANISFNNSSGKRVAFDICPVNIVLNALANKLGEEFDKGGKISSKGEINEALLFRLNNLNFYKNKSPKSLGREWIEKEFFPVLNTFKISLQDKLRTVVEHAAMQISTTINLESQIRNPKLLVTGGGVYNKFLMRRILQRIKCKLAVPDNTTIQFKEAMAFAFLGVLKIRGEINILQSVTGAKRNSSGGKIYGL